MSQNEGDTDSSLDSYDDLSMDAEADVDSSYMSMEDLNSAI